MWEFQCATLQKAGVGIAKKKQFLAAKLMTNVSNNYLTTISDFRETILHI